MATVTFLIGLEGTTQAQLEDALGIVSGQGAVERSGAELKDVLQNYITWVGSGVGNGLLDVSVGTDGGSAVCGVDPSLATLTTGIMTVFSSDITPQSAADKFGYTVGGGVFQSVASKLALLTEMINFVNNVEGTFIKMGTGVGALGADYFEANAGHAA